MTKAARVVVAMSGGVDSSVTAALLHEQGYETIGVMMRLWSESGREENNRCCTPDAMTQARRVAAILGIPFYVLDAQTFFHDTVVNYFMEGYTKGITPNPCLICNRHVRWKFLLDHALSLGAQYLATGHYARLSQDSTGLYRLQKAEDGEKDQSYILHVLGQDQLSRAMFPLGAYLKSQVRQIAHQYKLPVAERVESQDLCFLGNENYHDFLLRNAPAVFQPGPILDHLGKQIGKHNGLAFYTIGQRKGIGISAPHPLYVIAKDPKLNALIVGPQHELGSDEFVASQINWISGHPPYEPFRSQIKIRYKSPFYWGIVTPTNVNKLHVKLESPVRDITPGQAAVFYDQDNCLGGGIIQFD